MWMRPRQRRHGRAVADVHAAARGVVADADRVKFVRRPGALLAHLGVLCDLDTRRVRRHQEYRDPRPVGVGGPGTGEDDEQIGDRRIGDVLRRPLITQAWSFSGPSATVLAFKPDGLGRPLPARSARTGDHHRLRRSAPASGPSGSVPKPTNTCPAMPLLVPNIERSARLVWPFHRQFDVLGDVEAEPAPIPGMA